MTHRAGLVRVWSLTCSSQSRSVRHVDRSTHKPIEEPKCTFAFRHSLFIPKDDCRFLVAGWKQNIIWEAQVGIFVEQCKWGNFNIVKKVQNNFLDSRRYQDGFEWDCYGSVSSSFSGVKRLMREAKELNEPTELYFAQPLEVNKSLRSRLRENSKGGNYIYRQVHLLQNSLLVTQCLIDVTCRSAIFIGC